MAAVTFPANANGLNAPVMIGLKAEVIVDLIATGLPIPPPISCRAVVDCGTTVTNVASWILQQLGVGTGMPATAITAGGVVQTNVHSVSLSLLDPGGLPVFTLPTIFVAELTTRLDGAEVLIGLNALLEINFLLDGPAGQFSFIF